MVEVFEAADLRTGLKNGGQVLGGFIVARAPEKFVVYIRVNWVRGRGFRLIRTWRGTAGDRTFKHLDSAWRFVPGFAYPGRITVYPAGDPEMQQFVDVAPEDLGATEPAAETGESLT